MVSLLTSKSKNFYLTNIYSVYQKLGFSVQKYIMGMFLLHLLRWYSVFSLPKATNCSIGVNIVRS